MIPNHDGSRRDPDEAPLGAPPPIGRIRSATTNARRDGSVREVAPSTPNAILGAMRIASIGLAAGALLAFAALAAVKSAPPELMIWGAGAGLAVGIALGARSARRVPPVHESWVGDEGLAQRTGGKLTVMRFADVARVKHDELATAVGRMVVETFVDAGGKTLINVGTILEDGASPPTVHSAHFHRAAMAAWEAWRTTRQPATSPAR
jgi:hypothetical protein